MNGFTILCYFTALPGTPGRATDCRDTLIGLPIWNDAAGLLAGGGNFGCHISPSDPYGPGDAIATCHNDYQHDLDLDGSNSDYIYMMVCIYYPYEGIDATAAKRKL